MPDASRFALLLVSSFVLLVVPGPAVLYIVARSIDQGWRAGVVSVLGIALGSVVLVFAAAFGISALVENSPVAYDVVRYAGGAYLVYLGIRTWRTRDAALSVEPDTRTLRRVFGEGVVVNFLNPKTLIFFVAFLPQFVDPSAGIRFQLVLLGLVFVAMGVVTDCAYALIAGAVAARLRGDPRFPRARRLAVGAVYVGLGLLAAAVHAP